jgi:hypothetical protein
MQRDTQDDDTGVLKILDELILSGKQACGHAEKRLEARSETRRWRGAQRYPCQAAAHTFIYCTAAELVPRPRAVRRSGGPRAMQVAGALKASGRPQDLHRRDKFVHLKDANEHDRIIPLAQVNLKIPLTQVLLLHGLHIRRSS